MKLETNISNDLGQDFEQQLINNFKIIDKSINKDTNSVTQEQLSEAIEGIKHVVYSIVVGSDAGDSSIEVSISRTNVHGKEYQTIGARIDAIEKAIIKQGVI